jgi:predicted nuclease of restriction endonuclease-like (RecB) superfamily
MKRMRQFYEEWEFAFSIRPLIAGELKLTLSEINTNRAPIEHEIRPLMADEIISANQEIEIDAFLLIRQPITGELTVEQFRQFLSIGFTHHCEIIAKTQSITERLFYIESCATEFWSKEKLQYHLKSKLYTGRGKLPNNFQTTITDKDLQRKALLSFKDEYLLDYINIESPDDEPDERVLEREIVSNIRKFIMSLGKDFSFIGNQHRLIVEEDEYFADLLFFNRQLQCLVAFDLKRGSFKPEYLGKMNFYLSALDDLVRLPHEKPSIGIVLCKSQKQKIVEYAFRDMSKPMGVATYKTASELPPEYKNVLPDAEQLKELM